MLYLLLAIVSSAMVSVIMRLSSEKVSGNVGMLAVNYLMCLAMAWAYAGWDGFLPCGHGAPAAVLMGAVNGCFYLAGFLLLQTGVKKYGVVLSSVFMKLGLLVPIVVSVAVFGEKPALLQAVGFCLAVAAIVLINYRGDGGEMRFRAGLLLLLLAGGSGDAMSKVFEEVGDAALSEQFLLYTFAAALVLCAVLMLRRGQRPGKWEVLFGLLIGIPNYFSARFLLRSLETLPAVIAYPTFSVGTILVITITGLWLFRERLSRRQWLAVAIILLALVLLNI